MLKLPEVPSSEEMIAIDYTPQSWYKAAQQDMIEAGWRPILSKEELNQIESVVNIFRQY